MGKKLEGLKPYHHKWTLIEKMESPWSITYDQENIDI